MTFDASSLAAAFVDFDEDAFKNWFEEGFGWYFRSGEPDFSGFKGVSFDSRAYLIDNMATAYAKLGRGTQKRFSAGLRKCLEHLSPDTPEFHSIFSEICDLTGRIGAVELLPAIQSHLVVGPLRRPASRGDLEAVAYALDAIDFFVPRSAVAKQMIDQLFGDVEFCRNNATMALVSRSSAHHELWPDFFIDFLSTRDAAEAFLERRMMQSIAEELTDRAGLRHIASRFQFVLSRIEIDRCAWLLRGLIEGDDRRFVAVNRSQLMGRNFYPSEPRFSTEWFLADSANVDFQTGSVQMLTAVEPIAMDRLGPAERASLGELLHSLDQITLEAMLEPLPRAA